jgi:hypothetical protein
VLDSAARAAVVHAAAKQITDGYIFPEAGGKAAQALEKALAAGSYDTLTDPSAFAQQLTADLFAVTHDKHLSVFPTGNPAPMAPVALPRSEGGVVRADRLAGDIGYIEIVQFPPLGAFKGPFDHAMAALEKTRALIIDARRHTGGLPAALVYLESYFLPKGARPVVVSRSVWRNPGTSTFRTEELRSVPTPFSYAGRPVYVLTSRVTFSGGEALAYGLKQDLRVAKVVGERTGGGAHPGGVVPVGGGFALFLPVGRGANGDWEGVGVEPDIAAPAPEALKVALERLGQKPSGADIDALSQARLFTPRTIPQTGTEAALRHLIEDLARGEPDYTLLEDDTAQTVRMQLPMLHGLYSQLGAIQSMTFAEVDAFGADVYDVKQANGAVRVALALSPEGKIMVRAAMVTAAPDPQR